MKPRARLAGAALAVAVCLPAFADVQRHGRAGRCSCATQGLDWPVVQFDASGTECQEVLPAAARTLLGIPLDRNHLGAFERVLGASPLRKQGDAGEYFEWRCWKAANGDGTVLVVGQGEVDAQVRVLGRGMAFAGRGECTSSKRVDRSLALGNGLRLGLTHGDLERKVGPATAAGAGWYDRTCLGNRPMPRRRDRPRARARPVRGTCPHASPSSRWRAGRRGSGWSGPRRTSERSPDLSVLHDDRALVRTGTSSAARSPPAPPG